MVLNHLRLFYNQIFRFEDFFCLMVNAIQLCIILSFNGFILKVRYNVYIFNGIN